MKAVHTLILSFLLLLICFTTSNAAQPAIEVGSHAYRFLLFLPGTSTNFPGGYAFGRETFTSKETSRRFLMSGTVDINPISSANTALAEGEQFTGHDNEFSVSLSPQWARMKWFSDDVYSALSSGPVGSMTIRRYELESGEAYDSNDTWWSSQENRKQTTYSLGWLFSVEAGWWFHDRVQLYAAWGLSMGIERYQHHYKEKVRGPNESYRSSDQSSTSLYFRTGTVAAGVSFLF